jgi:hypothetical protein
MLALMRTKNLRAMLALSAALSVIIEPFLGSSVFAAVNSNATDPVGDQLRDQLSDIINVPFDFCDPATEHDHLMAIITASGNLIQHQLANHPPGPDYVKRAEDRAVQANKADGGDLVEDLPYVTDYEDAGRRGDVKAQKELFAKMTPAAQAQAAQHDQNFTLAIKLLTPLADAGDVNAQLRLAGIYSFGTSGLSAKYLPTPDAKVLKIMKAAGMHWPPVEPPDNLPLAFKYFQLAAVKGDFFGQSGLARAYACGFGTGKNLILAYMWFSLALAQRGVTVDMAGASLPPNGHQKDYALDRDFITARMTAEEIEQAKQVLTQCFKSGYKNCD